MMDDLEHRLETIARVHMEQTVFALKREIMYLNKRIVLIEWAMCGILVVVAYTLMTNKPLEANNVDHNV